MSSAAPDDLRTRLAARLGTTPEVWDELLRVRPEYASATAALLDVPERGGHLEPKVRAFVRLALAGALTHLRASRMRAAMVEALDAGATREELLEVLMVSSTLGVHGMNVEILQDALVARGSALPEGWTERQEAIRAEYTAVRGYWRDFLDPTLRLAPDFLEAYLEFSGAPWRSGVLEPKVREFLYLAFDTSATHLHLAGLRVHIDNALGYGASADEIVEIMTIAAGMGAETLGLGVELLAELTTPSAT